jgi:hypothetical protein
VPAGPVEARAEPELHRRRQQELDPRRQHPVFAEQVAHHRQGQRCRQQRPRDHRPQVHRQAPQALHLDVGRIHRTRLVTGVAHRAPHQCRRVGHITAPVQHPRRFGRQVHGRSLHTGVFAQRLFDAGNAGSAGHATNAQVDLAGVVVRFKRGCVHVCRA